MPTQQFLFNDVQSAKQFIFDLDSERRQSGANNLTQLSRSSIDSAVRGNYGTWSHISSHRKEIFVHNRQDAIYPEDLVYLHTRDPTVHGINRKVPEDTWFKLPESTIDAIDSYFAELTRLKFVQKAIEADTAQRRDGTSFLYINASGPSPADPLTPQDEIFGFQIIPKGRVVKNSVLPTDTPDPLLSQHGIEQIEIRGDPSIAEEESPDIVDIEDPTSDRTPLMATNTTIHGSRLILFKEDQETDHWTGRPKIAPCYDEVWDWRDINWAQTQAQFEGDPISVEVDSDEMFGLDDESEQLIEQEIEEFISGAGQVFSPVQGITIERVGQQDLNDPTPNLRSIASRIATSVEFTAGQLLAMSRGAEQVTDQDILTYASEIEKRRHHFCMPVLQHMVRVGQFVGMLPRNETMPLEVHWPNLRTLSPREKAYVHNTSSMAMDRALQWNRELPREIERMFPEGEPIPEPRDQPEDPDNEDPPDAATQGNQSNPDDLTQRLQRIEQSLFELLNRLDERDEP